MVLIILEFILLIYFFSVSSVPSVFIFNSNLITTNYTIAALYDILITSLSHTAIVEFESKMDIDKKEQPVGHDNEKNEIDFDTGVMDDTPFEKEVEEHEVFKKNVEGVNFRTVGWPRASVIFLKSMSLPPNTRIVFSQGAINGVQVANIWLLYSYLCNRSAWNSDFYVFAW